MNFKSLDEFIEHIKNNPPKETPSSGEQRYVDPYGLPEDIDE